MSIVLLLLGCFILYGRSRFFPEHLSGIGNVIKQQKQIVLLVGYLFLLSSYVVFGSTFGWGTGFIIYLVCISLFYSLLVIVLPLHKRYIYLIALITILLICFENSIS